MLFNTQNYGILYKMNEFTYPTVSSLMRDKSLEKTQKKKSLRVILRTIYFKRFTPRSLTHD